MAGSARLEVAVVTREVQRVFVEASIWRLRLWQLGCYWRAELTSAIGEVAVFSLRPSSSDALEAVVSYFDANKQRHTGVVLRTAAEAELKFSNET